MIDRKPDIWRRELFAVVEKLTKGGILTAAAITILLFTALVNWNIYSWLILLAIIVVLAGWYFRK